MSAWSGAHVAAAAYASRPFGLGVDVGHGRAVVVVVGAQWLDGLGVDLDGDGVRLHGSGVGGFVLGGNSVGLNGFGLAVVRGGCLAGGGVYIVFFGH